VHAVAAAPAQALPPAQQDLHAAGLGQAARQRHGVRVTTEERRPHTLPVRRHLVRQQADRLPRLERLDELLHTGQGGGRGEQAGALARTGHEIAQPGLARRAEQHRHGMHRAEALCVRLGRDLETAQVGRQEQHPGALLMRAFDVLGAHPDHRHRPTQPQTGQLGHQLARLADRGQRHLAGVARLGSMRKQATSIPAREHKTQPAQQPAHRMQHGQRHPAQDAKKAMDQQGHRRGEGQGGCTDLI
jgi:hypothetical protein